MILFVVHQLQLNVKLSVKTRKQFAEPRNYVDAQRVPYFHASSKMFHFLLLSTHIIHYNISEEIIMCAEVFRLLCL